MTDRLYQTSTLAGIIKSLIRPSTFLLKKFFRKGQSFDTQKVMFDLERKKRRLAAFVAPTSRGKNVSEPGYNTNEYSGAYIKETTAFDPNRNFVRQIGERIGGGEYSPVDRASLNLTISLSERAEALTRRKEWMAASVMVDSALTISGEGIPETDIAFGRDPALTIVLAGNDRWSNATSNPLVTIQAAIRTLHRIEGVTATDVVFDPDAWDAAWTNEAFQKSFDNRRLDAGSMNIGPMAAIDGVMLVGTINNISYWVYSEIYVDEDGDTHPLLPSGTVLVCSDADAAQGIQLTGAILDANTNWKPLELYARSWVDNDTSQRQLQSHANTLVAPTRVNCNVSLQVL